MKRCLLVLFGVSVLGIADAQYLRIPAPETQQASSWSRCTLDPGTLTFDSANNTVSESEGLYTLSIQGGEIWNTDDYLDAACFTVPSVNDVVFVARVGTDNCTATCTNWKAGVMLRGSTSEDGSQMYYWTRIEQGLRHTLRSTLNGSASNDPPNPSSSTEPLPFWLMLRLDRDVPNVRAYYYASGSDPGTDPDTNWVFSRELTETELGSGWLGSSEIYAVLAVTPNDVGDLGDTATATFDNVSVTFPELDHSPASSPAIGLSASSYSVNEDAGTLTITVDRQNGSGTCSVDYFLTAGTAVAGTDYTDTSGTLSWTALETDDNKIFNVTILDRDGVAQGNTQLTANLALNTCSDTLGINSAAVTIIDQDQIEDPEGFPAQVPGYNAVIPGIAGFGANWGDLTAYTWGFCEVDNATLADLENCIETNWTGSYDCQLIYFSTSGLIDTGTNVFNPAADCIYIAGQTAPSPGIWIHGNKFRFNCNGHGGCARIAIAHVGVFGKELTSNQDSNGDIYLVNPASGDANDDFLFINVSAFWGIDSNFDISSDTTNLTIYQSIIGEPLRDAGHPDNVEHNFNMLISSSQGGSGNSDIDVQRSVFGHARSRSPLVRADDFGFYNNIVYNWNRQATQLQSTYATESNIEGNLYIEGPNTGSALPINIGGINGSSSVYVSGNCGVGVSDGSQSDLIAGGSSASSQIANAIAAGIVLDTIPGCTAISESNFGDLVSDCAGPRPAERAGGGGTEIKDFLNTVAAGIANTSGQGGYLTPSDVSPPTVAENTVNHTTTAYPIPTGDPNGTTGVYVNNAIDWAAYWHEQVTDSKCGQERP